MLTLLGAALIACGPRSQSTTGSADADAAAAEEQRWEEVMAVHDEVMPKMADINRLSRQLKEYLDTHPQLDAGQRATVEAVLQQLAAADEGMWAWMNDLKSLNALRDSLDHAGVMASIDQEMKAIEEVKQAMLQAIEQGEQVWEELEK